MPLIISLNKGAIASAIKGKYTSFTHDEKIPSAGSGGNVTVTLKMGIPNTVTPDVAAIIDSVAEGVHVKVKTDLDAIKTQIDAMMSIFNSHMHPTAMGPSGPPTTPMV